MNAKTTLSRRDYLRQTASAVTAAGIGLMGLAADSPASAQEKRLPKRPIPVILDTDIGDDIDDTWALTMLLQSPQFDLKLVTTTNGKAEYRAKLLAKLLTAAGRTDVPVGLGTGGRDGDGGQAEWVKDYALTDYPGTVYQDGSQALIDTVNALAKKRLTPTIIALGPLTTLDAVLQHAPDLAPKTHFAGMLGSVRKGYDNNPTPCVEYNVTYVPGSKRVFTAPWRSMTITPLDTCGLVHLRGEQFAALKRSANPMVKTLLENYRLWAKKNSVDELTESSVLFDTVAVYLADPAPKPLIELEPLNIKVTDTGMTVIDSSGAAITVASRWKDLPGYEAHLVKTLEAPVVKAR